MRRQVIIQIDADMRASEGALPRRRDRETRREATAYSCTGDDDDDRLLSAPIQFNFETQWTAEDNAVITRL